MSIKLYGAILSPFVRKTRVFLALKGLDYEAVNVDPNSPPEGYEKLNPLRRIPAIEVDGHAKGDGGSWLVPRRAGFRALAYRRARWLLQLARQRRGHRG